MTGLLEKPRVNKREEQLTEQIMSAVRSIKHGHVLITIHDAEVVQIEKTEKVRVPKPRDCICRSADPTSGGNRSSKKV